MVRIPNLNRYAYIIIIFIIYSILQRNKQPMDCEVQLAAQLSIYYDDL